MSELTSKAVKKYGKPHMYWSKHLSAWLIKADFACDDIGAIVSLDNLRIKYAKANYPMCGGKK
jgi:hypothetical protein